MFRFALAFCFLATATLADPAALADRPAKLVAGLPNGALKTRLSACLGRDIGRHRFSIAHRGAPLGYPEHSAEGYRAAVEMGAGLIECDVTFTADLELVCRHSQNDLHRTTNILLSPLAPRCTAPFAPASDTAEASAECRTSDLTLAEFLTLEARPDKVDAQAITPATYLAPKAAPGQPMSHAQYIALVAPTGADFIPELKAPVVDMPFRGLTRAAYAQKMIDAYKQAGIPPGRVWPQSFHLEDIRYWLAHEPAYARQAVFLDGRYRGNRLDPLRAETFEPSMQELREMGLSYIAPPLWMLLTLEDGRIVASPYAKEARAAGLQIIPWTLERSGTLEDGGGWYFRSITPAIRSESDYLTVLDALVREAGIAGIFSDWPATTSFYAACMGLP